MDLPFIQPLTTLAAMDSLLINEIFFSIQGEATHSGHPCIFVRTTGCQMRCSYCDTTYAFHEGQRMTVDQIMDSVRGYPSRLVEITGGEPLLQKKSVVNLSEKLLQSGYEVLLETGGGFSLDGLPEKLVKIVDIKTPGSQESDRMNWSFIDRVYPNTFLKFVITSIEDYDWSRMWLRDNQTKIHSYPVYFSPAYGTINPSTLAENMLRDGVPARLQLQLHKILWGDRRGV